MALRAAEIDVNIEQEIKRSYLDYAMSVIIGRALPDIRDGLKPVHRRIFYAMQNLKNDWNKPYKKSARIVGDVIGKYHPHGDAAVYDAMVRMAQDFSMRYPLIDGQGNFGSVDGDPPAAMRYTEVRMARLAHEMLEDLEKDTVDFVPNYDGSLAEPSILPARIPNLLINGSSGIAVGMATNVPPHNLREVINATLLLIKNPDVSIEELLSIMPGPDFPTGGLIYGEEGIAEAYGTGKGAIRVRAKAEISGRSIVITEIPYQVNKAKMIENIAELAKTGRIEGIQTVRDESDREGLRVVIELRRDEIAEVVLNQLYKHSQMEVTFGIIFLAIVNGRPELLSLKELLNHYVTHRREIIVRRTSYELRQAEDRLHILEGLRVALDNLDAVISRIRSSKGPAEAKTGLIREFGLSEIQAQAILDMRLQRLTRLERDKITQEYKQILKDIKRYKGVLADDRKVLALIEQELKETGEKYGDERKTDIERKRQDISFEDLIVEEDMVVTVTHSGYIKRTSVTLYRSQRRGGKGVTGAETKEDDFLEHLFVASTHSYFLIFTNKGQVFWLKVHRIPQAGRSARGKAIQNLIPLSPDESIRTILPVRRFEEGKYVIIATQKGLVKKTSLLEYSRPRSTGIRAITIHEGDEVVSARVTSGNQEVFLGSRKGQAIQFKEEEARCMGRTAMGIRGMTLGKEDQLVGMEVVEAGDTILTVTENGYGKRTRSKRYRIQHRGGKGIINIKVRGRNGDVVGVARATDGDEFILITNKCRIIRVKAKDISVIGRNTQGVRLIDIERDDRVVAMARLAEEE
jgi:DNA gyrase subunit A